MNLPGARERFEQVRKAVERLSVVQLKIMYECDDWRPPSVSARKAVSDPTANAAIRHVDELESQLKALREEEGELIAFIGETLAVIQAVRAGLGSKYADLLEWRYIDLAPWSAIQDEHGVAKSTGSFQLGVAFDWIDSVGISRLLKGETEV